MSRSSHFSGRTLSGNSEPPVSPRRNRLPYQLAQPKVTAAWSFDASVSGNQLTLHNRVATLVRKSDIHWFDSPVSLEGHPMNFIVAWRPATPFLEVELEANFGAGFVPVSFLTITSYPGVVNYATGGLYWPTFPIGEFSVFNVFLTGPWQEVSF